ncbi:MULTISPECIES: hypothetical protein [unclassified Nocardiopsis]|uniref:hypothetical protein n=1 Tax=Nocardiopsis TaxID=2013 RepID=UPI00387B3DB8
MKVELMEPRNTDEGVSVDLVPARDVHLSTADIDRVLALSARLAAIEGADVDDSSFEGRGGRARKVSVSMPEELAAAIQRRAGRGEFSRYVTEAVASRLEADLLTELVELLEAEYGPVSDEALAKAEALWPDVE